MSSENIAPLASSESSNAQKYKSQNPIMRLLLGRFLETVVGEVQRLAPRRIVDLGCGEGMVARAVGEWKSDLEYLGIELSPTAAQVAAQIVPWARIEQGNILTRPVDEQWAELALCLEVLEHLPEPALAVERIARWTRDAAVVSVPWEPYFRLSNLLRGKYLSRWGNHPEHIQAFNPKSFSELLSPWFEEVKVRTCFPWLIAVARRPKTKG